MVAVHNARALRRAGATLIALAVACAGLLACAGGARSPRAATVPARAAGADGVPILLYHQIATAPASVPASKRNLYVAPRLFRQQIDALARAGYHGVTLGQVWRHWQQGTRLPSKPVVVSFDDGYANQYTAALPVLRRHRWHGVLNLQVNRIDLPGGLSTARLEALIAAGWEIDDHTLTHPDLTTVDADQLRAEVVDSRAQLQQQLGVAADFFCYPYGHFDDAVEAAVRDAGFLGATTTQRGLASPTGDPYALNRIIVGVRTSASVLLRTLQRTR